MLASSALSSLTARSRAIKRSSSEAALNALCNKVEIITFANEEILVTLLGRQIVIDSFHESFLAKCLHKHV